jgi:hypothetical protein
MENKNIFILEFILPYLPLSYVYNTLIFVSKTWYVVIHKKDITLGRDLIQIKCSCTCHSRQQENLRCACWMHGIKYIRYNKSSLNLTNEEICGGCKCKRLCPNDSCLCSQRMNNQKPYHNGKLDLNCQALIFECNPWECVCDENLCQNRVVQHGSKDLKLELFPRIEFNGFGIRTMNSIQVGTFICTYTGILLSDSEAKKKLKEDEKDNHDVYLLIIQEFFKDFVQRTNIDAKSCGNFSRFFNHSCEPNMSIRCVRVESMVPRIAFFTTRNIQAGEELTFDYGSCGRLSKRKCYCGSKICVGFLPHSTLEHEITQ